MTRRGREKEALILARELCASGYPAAVARRLMIIACEDVGLANPAVVAQVHPLCMGCLLLKKDARAGVDPKPLAIYMSIMLLARSPKNRECDDAQIWLIGALEKKLVTVQQVIDQNPVIADKHTDRGKARLRNLAVVRGTTYQLEADREFFEEGTLPSPSHPFRCRSSHTSAFDLRMRARRMSGKSFVGEVSGRNFNRGRWVRRTRTRN